MLLLLFRLLSFGSQTHKLEHHIKSAAHPVGLVSHVYSDVSRLGLDLLLVQKVILLVRSQSVLADLVGLDHLLESLDVVEAHCCFLPLGDNSGILHDCSRVVAYGRQRQLGDFEAQVLLEVQAQPIHEALLIYDQEIVLVGLEEDG